jgi:fructokinase
MYLEENINLATFTKGSDEDFANIFGINSAEQCYKAIRTKGCETLIYTKNKFGASFLSNYLTTNVPAIRIQPLSTVGAGDTFTAGMVYWLYKNKIMHQQAGVLDQNQAEEMLKCAVAFATNVCGSYHNYISHEFADTIKKI